jgi:hypothetical protein
MYASLRSLVRKLIDDSGDGVAKRLPRVVAALASSFLAPPEFALALLKFALTPVPEAVYANWGV